MQNSCGRSLLCSCPSLVAPYDDFEHQACAQINTMVSFEYTTLPTLLEHTPTIGCVLDAPCSCSLSCGSFRQLSDVVECEVIDSAAARRESEFRINQFS